MTQDFGITAVLEKQAHSWLRNCFSSAVVESKGKSDSGIIEFSLLSMFNYKLPHWMKVFYEKSISFVSGLKSCL